MTLLEAIKESVGYPISDNRANMTLIKHGLNKLDTVDQDKLTSRAFELATADLMNWLVTAPNVNENGFSISLTEKALIKKKADGIYAKWGVSDGTTPTARFISIG